MMSLEFNKAAAAVLCAGLIAMTSGQIAKIFYHTNENDPARGYQVEVASVETTTQASTPEEVIDIAALLADADANAGKTTAKRCVTCHSFDKGGRHKVGPNLYDVVNAPKASKDGFSYSSALKKHGGNWDHDALYQFLKKPKKYVPGTKMAFAGLKKPKQIADLIAYLESHK